MNTKIMVVSAMQHADVANLFLTVQITLRVTIHVEV